MTEQDFNIAVSIERFRKEFGLTKTAVATTLGIKPPSYELERTDRTNNPGAKTIFKLALAYGVSTDYLLGLTDDPTPHWTAQEKSTVPEKQPSEPREKFASTELAKIKTRLAQIELALKDAGIKIAAPESK